MALKFKNRARNLLEVFLWSVGVEPDWGNAGLHGRYGEWLGRKLLRSKGYRIIVSNWRSACDRRQEIDIICQKDGILIFTEVRARAENALVNGFDSIGKRKMKSLKRSFNAYLREASVNTINHRFDMIEVDLPVCKGSKPKIFHHENVAIFG
jgi:putative endonuclease